MQDGQTGGGLVPRGHSEQVTSPRARSSRHKRQDDGTREVNRAWGTQRDPCPPVLSWEPAERPAPLSGLHPNRSPLCHLPPDPSGLLPCRPAWPPTTSQSCGRGVPGCAPPKSHQARPLQENVARTLLAPVPAACSGGSPSCAPPPRSPHPQQETHSCVCDPNRLS